MRGELWAMMLDAKRTWDELIERHAPDEQTRDAVLSNRIYQELSNAVAGSKEYMAMEKLYELHHEGRYDLLVLDTPPTRNALDFLDAPERLSRFIDSRSLQFFLTPGRIGLKVFGRGTGMVFVGAQAGDRHRPAPGPVRLLPELRRHGGGHPRAGRARGRAARRPPRDASCSSPRPSATRSTRRSSSAAACARARMPFGARDREPRARRPRAARGGRGPTSPSCWAARSSRARSRATSTTTARLAERDRENVDAPRARAAAGEPICWCRYLDEDVHDVAGLERVNEYLFAAPERAAA